MKCDGKHDSVNAILACSDCDDALTEMSECSICGDEHGESAHGDPLVMRDTGRDTITGLVDTFRQDASDIIDTITEPIARHTAQTALWALHTEWLKATMDERDEYAPEYLDDIDAILTDAGYHAITDGGMGTWSVYAPVASQVSA